MLRRLALLPALFVSGAASAQEIAPPVETVPVWQALVMLLFLLVVAMIVISFLCKIAILVRLVPMKPKTGFQRVIHWLARVVGNVEHNAGRESTTSDSMRGGGGSFGGGGSSGNY